MDTDLIENWNDKVTPNDIVYHLGDFAWGKGVASTIVPNLNGKIILFPGNHDTKLINWYAKQPNITISRPRFYKQGDVKIWMSHYAHMVWPEMHYGSRHIYGHSHGAAERHTKGLCFDIGVDCTEYTPLSYQEVMDRFSKMDHSTTFATHMELSNIEMSEWSKFESYYR